MVSRLAASRAFVVHSGHGRHGHTSKYHAQKAAAAELLIWRLPVPKLREDYYAYVSKRRVFAAACCALMVIISVSCDKKNQERTPIRYSSRPILLLSRSESLDKKEVPSPTL